MRRCVGLTLAQYAEAKRLPEQFLKSVGLRDVTYMGAPAVHMPYLDRDGNLLSVRFRIALEGDRFRWRSGSKPVPYGMWRLGLALTQSYIVLVEGESDAHTLWLHEFPALAVPGAATWQPDRDRPLLEGIDTVYAIIEPDAGGETLLSRLGASIPDRLHVIDLGEYKDASGLYLAVGDQFRDRMEAAIAASMRWSVIEEQRRQREARAAHGPAQALLDDPSILEQVREGIERDGWAGDSNVPLLVYLAMTSRLLPRKVSRPINLALVSQSASGKNWAIEVAARYINPEAIERFSAASERALVYLDKSLQHRVVVFGEADSIPDEGSGAAAIRSIAEDGEMTYVVVEKNPATGRFEARTITKPGPTGLITTSTKPLRDQFGTRVLELSLPDDATHTRRIMAAQAKAAAGRGPDQTDVESFVALQRYLEAADNRVVVPFAEQLAMAVPANAVRMRRDFPKIIAAIQTHALLHQAQRLRDSSGAIIATIADYEAVRPLLAAALDVIAADGVTPAMRKTIEAVPEHGEISVAELRAKLPGNLSERSVQYRAQRCIAAGYLVNAETRQRQPLRISRGAATPETRSALPVLIELRNDATQIGGDTTPPPPTPLRSISTVRRPRHDTGTTKTG